MYDDLVCRLRECATEAAPCTTCDRVFDGACSDTLMKQAADAIVALSQENESLYAELGMAIRKLANQKKSGHWSLRSIKGFNDMCICSECGNTNTAWSVFCPNCGARMDGEQDV